MTERLPDALATKTGWQRPPRPKVRRLTADEQENLLAQMVKEIARSPVLSGFGIKVRFLRGRFYVERPNAPITQVDGEGR